MKLVKGKKYYDIAAHRYVWYVRTRNYYFGEPIEQYIFEDVCGAIIAHETKDFDIDKWLEEVEED